MSAVTDWYRGRSRREQVMLGAMAIVAVPVLVWLLLVRPITDWHDRARVEALEASDRLGRIRTLVELREQAGGTGTVAASAVSQPVADFVAASAEQAGFALTRNSPQGSDRTDIGIAQARPDAALGWIASLRSDGLIIESVRMSDNGEGGVSVDLVVAKTR